MLLVQRKDYFTHRLHGASKSEEGYLRSRPPRGGERASTQMTALAPSFVGDVCSTALS